MLIWARFFHSQVQPTVSSMLLEPLPCTRRRAGLTRPSACSEGAQPLQLARLPRWQGRRVWWTWMRGARGLGTAPPTPSLGKLGVARLGGWRCEGVGSLEGGRASEDRRPPEGGSWEGALLSAWPSSSTLLLATQRTPEKCPTNVWVT